MISLGTTVVVTPILLHQVAYSSAGDATGIFGRKQAQSGATPMATSGNNVYVTWWSNKWSNKTGVWVVFFRASAGSGNTWTEA